MINKEDQIIKALRGLYKHNIGLRLGFVGLITSCDRINGTVIVRPSYNYCEIAYGGNNKHTTIGVGNIICSLLYNKGIVYSWSGNSSDFIKVPH